MEARGNGITYPAQGSNFVRSSLAYGPLAQLAKFIFGWQSDKRLSYADGFHVYRLEWNEKFIRMSVDARTLAMLTVTFDAPFFNRGGFPDVVQNGSVEAVVLDPWMDSSAKNAAPFDQGMYYEPDFCAPFVTELTTFYRVLSPLKCRSGRNEWVLPR